MKKKLKVLGGLVFVFYLARLSTHRHNYPITHHHYHHCTSQQLFDWKKFEFFSTVFFVRHKPSLCISAANAHKISHLCKLSISLSAGDDEAWLNLNKQNTFLIGLIEKLSALI